MVKLYDIYNYSIPSFISEFVLFGGYGIVLIAIIFHIVFFLGRFYEFT